MKAADQKVNFILLAAGSSTRMGQDKAQLLFQTQPWIYEQAKRVKESGNVLRLIVVAQPLKATDYQNILSPLQDSNFHIQIVTNPDPMSKPSDSIRCALNKFDSTFGAFISPIDVPQVSQVLREILRENTAEVVRPVFQSRPGHPVWVSGKLLNAFLSTETRLDEFLRGHAAVEKNVKVDSPEVLMNLNNSELWNSYLSGGI